MEFKIGCVNRQVAPAEEQDEWRTQVLPTYVAREFGMHGLPLTKREEMERFLVVVRGDADPVCSREKRIAREDRATERAKKRMDWGDDPNGSWRALRGAPVEFWEGAIEELLSDGRARTFNAICVELADKTADVLSDSNPEWALWHLVMGGSVAYTRGRPVLFRRTQ